MPEADYQALKKDVDTTMLLASGHMIAFEQLDGKSADYISGFFAGIEHESNFVVALLSPLIARMNESISELLKA